MNVDYIGVMDSILKNSKPLPSLLFRTLILLGTLLFCAPSSANFTCAALFKTAHHPRSPKASNREAANTIFGSLLNEKSRNDLALEVVRQIENKKAEQQNTTEGWLKELVELQNKTPLSVIEHTSLAYVYSSGVIKNPHYLKLALQKSYKHLSGKKMPIDGELNPLPESILQNARMRARLFHDEILIDAVLKEDRVANTKKSTTKVATAKRHRLRRLARHLNIFNVTTVLIHAAALSFHDGRVVLAAVLLGMVQASLNEYIGHIGIGHAPEAMRKIFRKSGRLGQFMDEMTLTHHIHHLITAKRFAIESMPPEIQQRADIIVRKLVEKFVENRFTDRDGKVIRNKTYWAEVRRLEANIKAGNYGTNATRVGAFGMLGLALPFYMMNVAIYGATGSVPFLVASTLSLTGWLVQSLYSHRYMHIRPEDLATTPNTTWLQRSYRKSYLGQLQTRLHVVHHDSPWSYDKTRNGVVMAFSIADRLIKGVEYPSLKVLLEMDHENLLGD